MLGTVVGVFIPAVLQNGFVIVGVEPFWQRRRGRRRPDRRRLPRPAAAPDAVPGLMRTDPRPGGGCHAQVGSGRCCWRLAAATVVACGGDDDSGGGGGADAAEAARTTRSTLIAGVKGDEFYITMHCGAQEAAKAARRHARLPGPGPVRRRAADPDRRRGRGQEARRDPDRADRHARRCSRRSRRPAARTQARARRHHARGPVDGRVADRLRQRRGRQRGRRHAARADRRQGQGAGRQRQARHLHHRRSAAKGFEEGVKGKPGVKYLGQEYSNDDPAKAAVDRHRDARQAPRPEGHLRGEPVLRRGRGEPACARPASSATSRSSASTPAPSRSRTSRTGSCRP